MASITAKTELKNKETGEVTPLAATVECNVGVSLKDKIELWTEEAVNNKADAAMVIEIQALIRRGLVAGMTAEQIQTMVDEHKIGQKINLKLDTAEAIAAKVKQLGPEEVDKLKKLLANK